MLPFEQAELYLSKISTCVFVPSGTGQQVHKNRPNHGLVINLSGSTTYNFDNGETFTVQAEELFYLPKFSNYEVARDMHGDCIAVNFDLTDPDLTFPFFSLSADVGPRYVLAFRQILEEWNARREGSINRCLMHLYSIICMCQQDKAAHYVPTRSRQLVSDGAAYIAAHLSDPGLSIASVAQSLGITPEYFRRLFHQTHGMSPKHYLLEMRMEKAREWIASGELHIGAIAQMCGYENESYFSREFKKCNGCTPTAYARQKG